MLWCCYFHPNMFLLAFVITFQTWPFKAQKIMASHFSLVSYSLFSSYTSCMGLRFVGNLLSKHAFLISQPFFTRFQCNLYLFLPYAYSTSPAIFRLKLSYELTRFQWNLSLFLPYAYSTNPAIFRLKLPYELTVPSNVFYTYSRVKDFTTDN